MHRNSRPPIQVKGLKGQSIPVRGLGLLIMSMFQRRVRNTNFQSYCPISSLACSWFFPQFEGDSVGWIEWMYKLFMPQLSWNYRLLVHPYTFHSLNIYTSIGTRAIKIQYLCARKRFNLYMFPRNSANSIMQTNETRSRTYTHILRISRYLCILDSRSLEPWNDFFCIIYHPFFTITCILQCYSTASYYSIN